MQPLLAIVADTWRQSKQQWVFIILLVMLFAIALLFALGTKVHEYPDNPTDEKYSKTLIWRWEDDPGKFKREDEWEGQYARVIADQQGREEKLRKARQEVEELEDKADELRQEYSAAQARGASREELSAIDKKAEPLMNELKAKSEAVDKLNMDLLKEARAEVKRRSADISDLQKAAESTLVMIVRFLTILTMLGFIAAASGYFPGLIAQGSIDSVLSRPVSRMQVFFGKYLGGLALVSAALFACWLIVFFSFGLINGVWVWTFFSALPMTLLAVALLYAIVAWVGLMTKSATLALVTGYFFYLVVDTAVTVMITVAPLVPLFSNMKWIVTAAETVKATFPNFALMRASAEASVFSVPIFEWQPIAVAAAWLAILLFSSYRRFARSDF